MSGIVDTILSLSGFPAYALIALLVGGEAAAFIGIVLPGEAALLFGGVLASQGSVSLPVLLVVAVTAAVVGDSLGYEFGRHGGPALQRSRAGRFVGRERWARGERFLERRGGPAVLLGRWVGVLRALVPSLAGMGRMPYSRFVVWNAAGALVWAPTVVLAGYGAGTNYRRVEHLLGRASLLTGLAVVVAGLGLLLLRALRRDPDRWRGWLRRRVDPAQALGLTLTTGLGVCIVAGAIFTVVLEDVLGGGGVARLDRPVLSWLAGHRIAGLTTLARTVTFFGSVPWVLLVTAVVAALWWRRGALRPALVLVVAVLGSGAITATVKLLVGRNRPPLPFAVDTAERGLAFPSGHALSALALYGTLAYLLARPARTARRTATAAGLLLLVVAVGLSRIYLGYHWVSDVLGSWTLGVVWLSAVVTADRVLAARHPTHGPTAPTADGSHPDGAGLRAPAAAVAP